MKNGQAVAENENKSNFLISVLKGVLIALSISLISICIFAFILRVVDISDNMIKPINMVIKILSIFFGCVFGLKKDKEMGLIKGLVIGGTYSLLSYIVFSLLAGNFVFSMTILNDVLFGAIIGAICGIIAVNFKKK